MEDGVFAHRAERRRNPRKADGLVDVGQYTVRLKATAGVAFEAMRIDGHYDGDADIAWLRFEGYHGSTVVSEEATWGLRDLDPTTRQVVGLEFWRASERLPGELLAMLPAPPDGVAG